MSFIEYLLLFISVLLGGGIGFYVKKNNKRVLSLVLAFSGAYLLGITVLHLMPGVFYSSDVMMGGYVLGGFFIQLFLEQLSGGVEHGHLHAQKEANSSFALSIMIGLCLHAFLEGMPLSSYESLHIHSHGHTHGHNHLLYGIILHKAPAAFALVVLLLMSDFSKKIVALCLVIFAMMSPVGGLLAENLNLSIEMQKALVAVVIGSFLHISTTIIFEADGGSHKISRLKLGAIILGMGIAFLSL